MINNLILFSGADIPFPQGQLIIHQPTIKEIGLIGEEAFFIGCNLLNFSKDVLEEKDKINLENVGNFEILMSIVRDSSIELKNQKVYLFSVLTLLFPNYEIKFSDKEILFLSDGQQGSINANNFEDFKILISEIFCFKNIGLGADDFNPAGDFSRKIAEKLRERKRKLNQLKSNGSDKISVFDRYISILAVGEHKDINSLLQYTVYQLFDEFQRFELKVSFDYYIQAKMAGAQNLKEVDDWMKDIHS